MITPSIIGLDQLLNNIEDLSEKLKNFGKSPFYQNLLAQNCKYRIAKNSISHGAQLKLRTVKSGKIGFFVVSVHHTKLSMRCRVSFKK